jgi:hypothetical protein
MQFFAYETEKRANFNTCACVIITLIRLKNNKFCLNENQYRY